jgi:hypothetical protein
MLLALVFQHQGKDREGTSQADLSEASGTQVKRLLQDLPTFTP